MGGMENVSICTCPGRPKIRSTEVDTEGERDTQQSSAVTASVEEWSRLRRRSPASENVWNIEKLEVGFDEGSYDVTEHLTQYSKLGICRYRPPRLQ